MRKYSISKSLKNLFIHKGESKIKMGTTFFLILIFIGLFGFAWSAFNIFYYLLAFSKIMTLFTFLIFILYVISGPEKDIEMWRNLVKRSQILREKMIYAYFKSYLLFGVCIILLLIIPLTGLTKYWQDKIIGPELTLVSSYAPNILEGTSIILNFILSLIISWNGMYFFAGTFLEIIKYDFEKKYVKIKLSGFLKNALLYTLIFWIFFGGLDLIFINILENKSFAGTEFLKTFFEPYVHFIPIFEIPILISLSLVFYLYGKYKFKNRTDLVIGN